MLYVNKNNNIRLTRGDTAKFVVSVQNESIREPYDILSSRASMDAAALVGKYFVEVI